MKIKKEKFGPLEIISLTTKREIKVNGIYFKEFEPELQAALGATLSRNPSSAKNRLDKILNNPIIKDRIMNTYFKKYGHNSVGDMGFFIFSIERISMKGAFHLLENQLFNGQEASTRYLDFSEMGFLPVNSEVNKLSKKLFKIYSNLEKDLKKYFIEKENMMEKEAEPRAFDIAGAFLPLSARTNVFWVGSIRTYITQIRKLMSLGEEEKEVGKAMEIIADEICPNSIEKVGFDYLKKEIKEEKRILKKIYSNKNFLSFKAFNLKGFKEIIKGKITNNNALGIFGNITYTGDFDFRSARDIHRHRAFRVNTVVDFKAKGVEEFYLNEIPKELRPKIKKEISEIIKEAKKLENGFYGMPMAVKFPYIISGDLPAWLYFLNLRTGPKVHPTVLELTKKIGSEFEKKLQKKGLYQKNKTEYSIRSGDKNKI